MITPTPLPLLVGAITIECVGVPYLFMRGRSEYEIEAAKPRLDAQNEHSLVTFDSYAQLIGIWWRENNPNPIITPKPAP